MELHDFLGTSRDEVLRRATDALGRAHLEHYEATGMDESRRRLEVLYALVLDCIDQRTLTPIQAYAELVAQERYRAGFDIAEVQTAFNVLEEAIWQVVIAAVTPEELAQATGLIGTVLGAGKDHLARTWVSLATNQPPRSLDLSALFEGAAAT